jgi:superfamily II DNA helicase RecQ
MLHQVSINSKDFRKQSYVQCDLGGVMIPYAEAARYYHKDSRAQVTQQEKLDKDTTMEDRIVSKVITALGEKFQEKIVEGVIERILGNLKSSGIPQIQKTISESTPNLHSPNHPHSQVPISTLSQNSGGFEVQCLEALRKLIKKPDANWTCSEQWKSLQEICKLQMDVLAIMRTGSGKSMLIILPSVLEQDQITVAILPLTSLIMDYSRKLQQLGVPFEVYKPTSKLHGHNNLILVSADMARTSRWKQEIAQLNERRPVVRMVFDEGQFAFTAASYRKCLQDLHDLRQFPFQMVVLSGTIPPQSQQFVIDSFGLLNPFIVRTSSNRPEIKYILEKPFPKSEAIFSRVQKIVSSIKIDSANPEDRYLIFVPYIEEGHKISESQEIDFYYSGKQDEKHQVDPRQKYYEDWFQGKKKGMVCTSAFGAGNDYSHVRVVIHAGTPKEMIGYVQESGRGGRDGNPSFCFILPKKNSGKDKVNFEEDDHQRIQAMYSMLYETSPTDCIRFHLTSFCDPIGTYCRDDINNQLCSGCSNAQSSDSLAKNIHDADESSPSLKRSLSSAFGQAYEGSKAKRIENHQSSGRYVELFHGALSFYIGNCAYCLALGSPRRETKHQLAKCLALSQQMDFYQALQEDLEYQDHHPPICWKCHVPQCHDQLHPEFTIGHEACEFKDIILPVVTAAFIKRKKEVCREFGKRWNNVVEAAQWFNEKTIKGHQSNLTALFLWYYYDHQQKNL